MKKIMSLFLAVFMVVNFNIMAPQKSEAAVLGAVTIGAAPAIAVVFFGIASLFGVGIGVVCLTSACRDGNGGSQIAAALVAAVVFDEAADNKVKVLSNKSLIKDLSYSEEEKEIIINDFKNAAARFGNKELKIDVQIQNPELTVAKLVDETGVSELTARYMLAESGIQTER